MEILDSDGRLFGYVNIIDALVVLFVLAIIVAGGALVLGSNAQPDSPSSGISSKYATVTIGPLSDDAAGALADADHLTVAGSDTTLQVVDSLRTPHPTRDAVLTVVRIRVPDGSKTVPLNRSLGVSNGQFTYNATLSSFTNESSIERQTRGIVLQTTVSEQIGSTIQRGDTHQLGDETVARVTEVAYLGRQDGQRRLLLALNVSTFRIGGAEQFAGRSLTLGTSLPLRTDAYSLTGTIVSRNGSGISTRNVTVRTEATVPASVVENVDTGDTYTVSGRTIAEIDAVSAYPVANSDRQRLVTTTTLQTVLTDGQPRFLGTPVRVGASIPFETSSYQLDGTVMSLSRSPSGSAVDATLRVEWENVSSEQADAVRAGMSERHRGADATISAVTREPATVILRTESGDIYARDHPVNEDVTLTVSVTARRTGGTLSFHGRPVQNGDEIVLDFGSVTVEGTVVGITTEDSN